MPPEPGPSPKERAISIIKEAGDCREERQEYSNREANEDPYARMIHSGVGKTDDPWVCETCGEDGAAARDEASDEEYDPFATVILDEGDDIVQCLRCTVRLRPVRRFVGQLRHWYWCQFPGEETNWGKWFVQR